MGTLPIAATLLLAAGLHAGSAESQSTPMPETQGLAMPETQTVAGTRLRLNGVAVRTYSWFRVKIYVAGLYLERATHDADQILHSNETKLIKVRFLHDVDAAQARDAWREGLENNCRLPCHISRDDIARFVANVPAMRVGDESSLAFAPGGLEIITNGHLVGRIQDRMFATAVLAAFIGPHPPTVQVKDGLLGLVK